MSVESEIHKQLVAKDQVRRFKRYTEVQNDLLATGKSLVTADSYEAATARFNRIVGHAEGLWDDACLLFFNGRYPTALAVSITCLEEIGKIGVARFQLVLEEGARKHGSPAPENSSPERRKHPFYSHPQKLLLAAGAGALVNARLDRVLGLPEVIDFLDRVERGEIEPLRQSCLYSDTEAGELLLPSERIDRKKAQFYVLLAGELLAEVAGSGPPEFERLLARVQRFEESVGGTSK
jgi:AbiV family abortive infection protein